MQYLSRTGCGTDSYGLSIAYPKGFLLVKNTGKIPVKGVVDVARKYIQETNSVIGHTRQATTGEVTLKNAHPFINEMHNITMVHNGIIDNYEHMKKKLELIGHKFSSECDSEILLHQFEENIKGKEPTPQNLADAINETCNGGSMVNMIMQMRDGTLLAYADTRLWKNVGKDGVLLATKPTTSDEKNWHQITNDTVLIARDGEVLFEKTYESKFMNIRGEGWYHEGWNNRARDWSYTFVSKRGDKKQMVQCVPEGGKGKSHPVAFRKAYYCYDCDQVHCKGHRHTEYIEKLTDTDNETLELLRETGGLGQDMDIDTAIETYSPSRINRMRMKKDEEPPQTDYWNDMCGRYHE